MRFSQLIITAVLFVTAVSCTEDPIPVYISGNPRADLVRDSIVVSGTAGETAVIRSVYMTPDGTPYAAGIELQPDGRFYQGNLWTHDGTVWRGALDAAQLDRVLSVDDVDGARDATVWAVASLKSPVGDRYSAVLRRDGDAWTDVSPDVLLAVDGIEVVSDNNVWVYGMSPTIYHYKDGTWTTLDLPEPWGSMNPFDVRVKSISADEKRAFVLLSLDPEEVDQPHVLFVYDEGVFTPLYREGEIEGAAERDRELQSLVRSRDGVVIAGGAGIYRWDGGDVGFAHLMNHPDGNRFHDAFLSPQGNLIFAGDNSAMRWSDSETWFAVHVNMPLATASFGSVSMADTMIVVSGQAAGFENVLLHGTITRIAP